MPPPLLPPSALRLQDIFALNAAYNRFYELNVALMMRLTLLAAKEASAAQVRSRGGSASACYRKCPGPANLVSIAAAGRARQVDGCPLMCVHRAACCGCLQGCYSSCALATAATSGPLPWLPLPKTATTPACRCHRLCCQMPNAVAC